MCLHNTSTLTYSTKPMYTSLAHFRHAHTWTYSLACIRVYYDAVPRALAVSSRPRSSTVYSVVGAFARWIRDKQTRTKDAILVLGFGADTSLSSLTLSRSPSLERARTLLATPHISSSLAHTVRWPCVSPAGSREPLNSLLVFGFREHPRILQSPVSLYRFPLATRTLPRRRPLS